MWPNVYTVFHPSVRLLAGKEPSKVNLIVEFSRVVIGRIRVYVARSGDYLYMLIEAVSLGIVVVTIYKAPRSFQGEATNLLPRVKQPCRRSYGHLVLTLVRISAPSFSSW